MGGHIDCYIDLNSIYSYFAFVHLMQNRQTLTSHDVGVAFHPVYLPALQKRSGNRVIWTVRNRQRWLERYELPRSKRAFGVPQADPPGGDLNSLFDAGLTLLPLQALVAIQDAHPADVFESALYWLYHCFWTPPQQRIKDEAPLRGALLAMPAGFAGSVTEGSRKQFSDSDVDRIMKMAGERQVKDQLRKNTDIALDTGGFGAPWMLIRNDAGRVEPFFGSDRFAQVYEFLGLPFQQLELLHRGSTRAKL
jgi:glutathione S-transferase kappa 1